MLCCISELSGNYICSKFLSERLREVQFICQLVALFIDNSSLKVEAVSTLRNSFSTHHLQFLQVGGEGNEQCSGLQRYSSSATLELMEV